MRPVTATGDVVGLITARGGSREAPRKNVLLVAGKPLIAWTIEAALNSPSLRGIIVSTDDEEIAYVSRQYGAEVPFIRPASLSGDDTPHMPVMEHAIDWMEANWGASSEYVMLLQPTSPLRTSEDIEQSIRLAYEKDADSVISVCSVKEHPYLIKTLCDDGSLCDFIPEAKHDLRQHLPPAYFVNGAIYLTRSKVLKAHRTFYPEKVYPYFMPRERSMQVDSLWDLELVNRILEMESARVRA